MKSITLLVSLCIIFLTGSGLAKDDDRIQIHGFGGWAYSQTDGNQLVFTDPDGLWDLWDFGLNISSNVTDRLRITAQLYADQALQDGRVEIDFAFLEYRLSDSLKLRAGKVKHPHGIYGEARRAGIIRTFFNLPISVYGHDIFVSKAYSGLGVIYENYGDDWGIYAHGYAGKTDGFLSITNQYAVVETVLGNEIPEDTPIFAAFDSGISDILGFYVAIETPVEGLKVGFSGYMGTFFLDFGPPVGEQGSEMDLIASFLEYNSDPFLVRSEFFYSDYNEIGESWYNFYIELGYKFSEQWQAVFRFDNQQGEHDVNLSPLPLIDDTDPAFNMHREYAFGINYFASPELVFRASYHMIDGLLFGGPEGGWDSLRTGDYTGETNMLIFGAQFSF